METLGFIMAQPDNVTQIKHWMKEGRNPLRLIGLSGSAQAYFLSRLLSNDQKPCLIVLPERKEAERLHKELRFFLSDPDEKIIFGGSRLQTFPPYDLTPLTGLSPQRAVVTNRLNSLYALLSHENPIVVTSLDALAYGILPKKALIGAMDYYEAGEDVDRGQLLEKLEMCGYQRTSLVEEMGDYAVRGGVIDVFSPLYGLPVRLEFWGDRLESIRPFDPLSQRSKGHLKEVTLLPANEIIMGKENIKRARSMGRLPHQAEDGMRFPGQEAWLNHFYNRLDTLFHYLPENGFIIPVDSHRMEPAYRKIEGKFHKDEERFRLEAAQKRVPFPEIDGVLLPFHTITHHLETHQRLEMSELDIEREKDGHRTFRFQGPFQMDEDLELRLAGRGRVSLAPLAEKISEWLESRNRVVLVSRTEQQANRLKEILANYEVETDYSVSAWTQVPGKPGLCICLGRLSKGFSWPDLGLYVISEDEIFGPKRTRSGSKKKTPENALKWSSFSQLKRGDFLVHEDHGIGRYGGLKKMVIQNKINDFICIEYAHSDRLYIPADRISVLQKYTGLNDGHPKMDRLGGRSWNLVKQRAKKSVKQIAKQLIQMYALRKYRKGTAFSLPDHHFREFEATFEHEETPDQSNAIEDVLEDMTSEKPMDRLICGDVGFGKTEVAVRAAFKAVSDGKQVALLVPTTVLAEQHYELSGTAWILMVTKLAYSADLKPKKSRRKS